jgi:outer membrane protein assembly factor BamB
MLMIRRLSLVLLVVICFLTVPAQAGDWPQFRYDIGRTAAAPHELPANLELRWRRTLATPCPAFPNELRLSYDASYEPVVLGKMMFVPSMVNDSLTAFDTETGAELWRFFAEGPVRFAPVAWQDKVYFVSDDGFLYCLNTADGSLRWKFSGLPQSEADRKVIGHGRLISLFPARGGPVLSDGVVYFAAGLWPTEGVFVHAVDAESGAAVWSNTKGNRIPASNWDHGVGQVAGLTPQGYLAIVGDRLIVPCGTQLPAFLDLQTGELQKYTMGWGGRLGLPKGCWFVAGVGKYLSHGGDLFDITRPSDERLEKTKPGDSDYKPNLYPGGWTRLEIERANQRELDRFSQPVMTADVMYESDQSIVARDLTAYTLRERTEDNIPSYRANDEVPDKFGAVFSDLWEFPSKLQVHIMAGTKLYAGGPGIVEAIDVSNRQQPQVVWHAEIEGTPTRMLAADDKLFVVTAEGSIFAFGESQPGAAATLATTYSPASGPDPWTKKAAAILEATGVQAGYALVLGIDDGRLVEELVRQSDLHVIAVDEDANQVATVRRRLDAMGLYGNRTSVVVGDPVSYPFSPYLASLVVSETPDDLQYARQDRLVEAVFHTLRPYGGVACAWGALADPQQIEALVQSGEFPGATVQQKGEFVLLTRSGALPGAADWSHAEADAASTGASADELRDPTSVLWFDASRRWHKYPGQVQVRVAGGRVVLYTNQLLQASDVFTGRLMWQVDLSTEALNRQRIRYTRHRQWGPRPSLSPNIELVALQDAIYLSDGTTCMVFDPATGKQVNGIDLPNDLDTPWANLRICGDYLVGSSGQHVLCMNRHTGELVWRLDAGRSSLYLAVGGDKVFCSELASPRRGEDQAHDGRIMALDLSTGERLWERAGGARFRYSELLDTVVTPEGFFQGSNGATLPQAGNVPRSQLVVTGGGLPKTGIPGYIAGNKLLAGSDDTLRVYELPSGERIGEQLKWNRRGCTGTRPSKCLMTTRLNGNSAWIDLESREITPFLGIRPACATNNNLYPANGVLNLPSLTAGCTCNYAPVSMACVPAAAVERRGER